MSDFWVFGYGSLMWRPGFPHRERVPALLGGAHRALCIYSWVHRGTQARPGLVLGLDRGGSCRGVAYRVDGGARDEVIAYLRERELVTAVYHETWRPVRLLAAGNRAVRALTYVADREHAQYAGRLPREALLAHVRDARGRRATTPPTSSTRSVISGNWGLPTPRSSGWPKRSAQAASDREAVARSPMRSRRSASLSASRWTRTTVSAGIDRRPRPIVVGPAGAVEGGHGVGGEAIVRRAPGQDHHGRAEIGKFGGRHRAEQVAAARTAAEIVKTVAEPRLPGEIRGLIGEDGREHGDHGTNIEH